MFDECMKHFSESDITVMAAAVADFVPEKPAGNKIKKSESMSSLKLKPTRDILAAMGERKKKNQHLIGFALETDDETANAVKKLKEKNLDMIVLNSLNDKGAGFEGDKNKITIFGKSGKLKVFGLKAKTEVACDIADEIITLLKKK
jgi:phosphopantothenoylcysteine decarboxylase/phosphopantothenate--cysteine ligase